MDPRCCREWPIDPKEHDHVYMRQSRRPTRAQFRLGLLGYTLPLAVTGALVALTAGFAAVASVRIVGQRLGGQPSA